MSLKNVKERGIKFTNFPKNTRTGFFGISLGSLPKNSMYCSVVSGSVRFTRPLKGK